MRDLEIYIGEDGDIQHVYDDELSALFTDDGSAHTRRASHVEPCGNGWTADMRPVGGPVLWDDDTTEPKTPFSRKSDALDAEVDWIAAHLQEGRLP